MDAPLSLDDVTDGDGDKPPRILLYASHGIGKTTFAADAPKPIFLQTEDGLGILKAKTFGLLKSYDRIMEAINLLLTGNHDRETVVVDSLDHLEPLLWEHVCRLNKWADIETPGYGKGYVAALDAWRELLEGFDALRDERGMTIIYLAHAEVKRFESPEVEPFDRYQIKLHNRTSALVQEYVDCVFFGNMQVATVETDIGFKKKIRRGVSGGARQIYTNERPAFLAKNRYAMPDVLPLDWEAVADHIPFFHAGEGADAPQTAA